MIGLLVRIQGASRARFPAGRSGCHALLLLGRLKQSFRPARKLTKRRITDALLDPDGLRLVVWFESRCSLSLRSALGVSRRSSWRKEAMEIQSLGRSTGLDHLWRDYRERAQIERCGCPACAALLGTTKTSSQPAQEITDIISAGVHGIWTAENK